jgi:hypothetical protein
MIVPFPISLIAIIGVFILLNLFMRKRMMRRMGMGGGGMFGGIVNGSLKYYCMSCGTKHAEAACPKCGSKMKRVGS